MFLTLSDAKWDSKHTSKVGVGRDTLRKDSGGFKV